MTVVRGELFDGTSTGAREVLLRLSDEGLVVSPDQDDEICWRFDGISGIEQTAHGFRCSLRPPSDGMIAPAVVFSDETFSRDLLRRLEQTRHPVRRFFNKIWRLRLWQLLIITVALIAAFFWVFFTLLLRAYTLTPCSYDTHLGHEIDSSFSRVYDRCTAPGLDAFLNKALQRLSMPGDRFPHRVIVINDHTENAVSIPGGTIYLFRGMLEKSVSPDEIIGVLSHEIAHAEKRHSVRQIIQSMGVYYMSSLAIGMAIDGVDMLDGLESMLEMSSLFFILRYSRGFEREADSLCIVRLHRAGLRVGGLDSLLTRISPPPRPRDRLLGLLSTHPLQQERSERFAAARQAETFAPDTMFNTERATWEAIKKGCGKEAAKPLWKKILPLPRR
jgi:Zn-dependent protease with chaperone function